MTTKYKIVYSWIFVCNATTTHSSWYYCFFFFQINRQSLWFSLMKMQRSRKKVVRIYQWQSFFVLLNYNQLSSVRTTTYSCLCILCAPASSPKVDSLNKSCWSRSFTTKILRLINSTFWWIFCKRTMNSLKLNSC